MRRLEVRLSTSGLPLDDLEVCRALQVFSPLEFRRHLVRDADVLDGPAIATYLLRRYFPRSRAHSQPHRTDLTLVGHTIAYLQSIIEPWNSARIH